MNRTTIILLIALICVNVTTWAQKPKSNTQKKTTTKTAQLSKAEKMGYQRTNKYYGPGTYYCYAPGKPINKMADNGMTALRDLTGLMEDDLNTELAKQGYVEIPKDEIKKWFYENRSKGLKFYYSPDKSFILYPNLCELYNSPVMPNKHYAKVSNAMVKYQLIPLQDSLKVMEAIYQYLRDMNEMKVLLGTWGSSFKNSKTKVYPIQEVASGGWTTSRAGTYVLLMVDGKPKGYWEHNEDIVRRNLGKSELKINIQAVETDFVYVLTIKLTKEGYVLYFEAGAGTINNLEGGTTWQQEYPLMVSRMKNGWKNEKDAVNLYKKTSFPPVLEDLNKFLHLK